MAVQKLIGSIEIPRCVLQGAGCLCLEGMVINDYLPEVEFVRGAA